MIYEKRVIASERKGSPASMGPRKNKKLPRCQDNHLQKDLTRAAMDTNLDPEKVISMLVS